MRKIESTPQPGFHVIAKTTRSEAATMVLEPGSATGGPDNQHADSDQWLLVLSGKGKAIGAEEEIVLAPGDLLLIEAGDNHEIRSTGDGALETMNFYAPNAY